jgi:hypothetical protein
MSLTTAFCITISRFRRFTGAIDPLLSPHAAITSVKGECIVCIRERVFNLRPFLSFPPAQCNGEGED